MRRRTVHQWRDWLLESLGEGNYELIQKETKAVTPVVAKDDMEAENKSQLIIKKTKEEQP
ncbi:hypothetical protein [Desulfosediminicola flagellatus]|uniref:hypothetical protein n=1 Tax=Desulfosediminicola flagellatus TaxID=2569541 RepID=UPI0010AD6E0C|nr:hypothetical protein [Desulfosediminicola flagellatus]